MDDDDWVVDSLIGFLESPPWTTPVEDFMENKCVLFGDAYETDQETYSEVHSEYKSMVEVLVDEFITQLSITPEQLSDACIKSKVLRPEHTEPLEPLLAFGDIKLFKKLMRQKNSELELEALQMFQKRQGSLPSLYQEDSNEYPTLEEVQAERVQEEERVLQEVLEESKREFEKKIAQEDEEFDRLTKLAKQESLKSLESLETAIKPRDPANKVKESECTAGNTMEVCDVGKHKDGRLPQVGSHQVRGQQQGDPKQVETDESRKESDAMSGVEAAQLWVASAKSELLESKSNTSTTVQIPDDPAARERYLQLQRDRLLASRKKNRADELKSYKTSTGISTHSKPKKKPSLKKTSPNTRKKVAPEKPQKKATAKVPVKDRGETDPPVPKSSSGGNSKTGVLCTVIAGKLKKDKTL